jgi:rhamnosyl/mannosyltransferase
MAYETPVINTNLPTGVPWVSKNKETGLTVPPRNPSALAEAITTLLADDERRDAYGQAACERVRSKFSQNNRINILHKIFKNL